MTSTSELGLAPNLPLEVPPGGADVGAESVNIGAVGADSAGRARQTEVLGLFDAQAGVVQFCQAVAFGRSETVAARHMDRARRTVGVPAFPSDLEEIVPVPTIPHGSTPFFVQPVGCSTARLGSIEFSRFLSP